jgi:hypothetical protein
MGIVSGVKALDEAAATQLIQALVERDLLMLSTPASAKALANALAEEGLESVPQVAEWLVDQDAVVDLLASDEDIEAALSGNTLPPPPLEVPAIIPPTLAKKGAWRWNARGTELTVEATTLDGVIDATREWWRHVGETAKAANVDALLCYLESDGLAAFGVADPKNEIATYAANDETTLPESVVESEWSIRCHIEPSALGDDDAEVLEEEPTFAMLKQAVGKSTDPPRAGRREQKNPPLYFWDAEWDGTIRRVSK